MKVVFGTGQRRFSLCLPLWTVKTRIFRNLVPQRKERKALYRALRGYRKKNGPLRLMDITTADGKVIRVIL